MDLRCGGKADKCATKEVWSDGGSAITLNHGYDAAGNLTTLPIATLTVDPYSDRLLTSGVSGYGTPGFDAEGELTSFNGATAVYSPLGQLTTITGQCLNATTGAVSNYSDSMVYDHLGRRAALAESLGARGRTEGSA
jgi:hypothetical protein